MSCGADCHTVDPSRQHATALDDLVVTVFGTIITALLGGMFLLMVSALDDVRDEIGSLRNEMNARFAEVDRRFDQIHSVLMDQTDRLARIETTLDIEGRPLSGEIDAPGDA